MCMEYKTEKSIILKFTRLSWESSFIAAYIFKSLFGALGMDVTNVTFFHIKLNKIYIWVQNSLFKICLVYYFHMGPYFVLNLIENQFIFH